MPSFSFDIPDAIREATKRADLWAVYPEIMLEDLGYELDQWQIDFLKAEYRRAMLCCSRRCGKTTVAALKALHHAMFSPADRPATVLIFAPAGKQSDEMLHTLHGIYKRLGNPVERDSDRISQLDFDNGSRIIPMTSNEESSLGFTPTLIIIDEAARVADGLYKAISPMLALKTNPAQVIALSTPFGKQGWFYNEWRSPVPVTASAEVRALDWHRVRVTADECPRIDRAYIEVERIAKGEEYVQQEYYCSFEQREGLVYPDMEECVVHEIPVQTGGRWLGGVDWGFHNPACILVGHLDRDDVLWIHEEVYGRKLTNEDLAHKGREIVQRRPIEMFYCDPAEPGSIETFRRFDLPAVGAGLGQTGNPGTRLIRPGIQAVSQRIRTGRLKVHASCTNLIAEAGLYRYPTEQERKLLGENPIDADNHALGSLRYLVASVDRVRESGEPLQRAARGEGPADQPKTGQPAQPKDLDKLSTEQLRQELNRRTQDTSRKMEWFDQMRGERGWDRR